MGRKVKLFAENTEQKPKTQLQNIPQDDDIHRFNELLDIIDRPVNTDDYRAELRQKPVVPTQTVVEVHRPILAPPAANKPETNSSSVTESTGIQIESDC